jgi:ADP-heptose:LPS heptosyltransferase
MSSFKHSGTFGDLIYSLPIMRHLGGGDFYLHLNQINWIGQHYYGSAPTPFHQGRMTQQDFEYMRTFMESQDYVNKFDVMTPSTEIKHNLDRFRPLFVNHPGNYVDVYAAAFGITNPTQLAILRNTPWLTVPNPSVMDENRTIVINRTSRWLPQQLSPQWAIWQEEGAEETSVFVGLPEEHAAFKKATGWDIPRVETPTMLDLAQIIAGSELFIGNQSVALSLAIGLGVNVCCEYRDDLPLERNECYFHDADNITYF